MLFYDLFTRFIYFILIFYSIFKEQLHVSAIYSQIKPWRHHRYRRQTTPRTVKKDFEDLSPKCNDLKNTENAAFIVMILYKTSGRFVAMGSLVDKRAVLTSQRLMKNKLLSIPNKNLLVLGGYRSPWWGKDAQVRHVQEKAMKDLMCLLFLKNPFKLNDRIQPINLVPFVGSHFRIEDEIYGYDWAVFGVPRTHWDKPGDATNKGTSYSMRLEEPVLVEEEVKLCSQYMYYNKTIIMYTKVNASFCWGCIGSPTVSMDRNKRLVQIAMLAVPDQAIENPCHIHVKIGPYEEWLRDNIPLLP